jgi:hypothetical protein
VNYKWRPGENGPGRISETAGPADGEHVFGTFAEARDALASHLGQEAVMRADAYRSAKRLRLSHMAGGEVAL